VGRAALPRGLAKGHLRPTGGILVVRGRAVAQPNRSGGVCINAGKRYICHVKRVGKLCLCLAGGLVLSAGLRAGDLASADSPYVPIVARNVFDIHPLPPVDPNQVNAEPPPKITPNGIMSIYGHLQALFKVAIPSKPGIPAKEQTYILSEGQQQDDIEVTRIDEKAGVVTFNNHGTVQDLPLTAATASGGSSGPAPGAPGMMPSYPMPGFVPGGGNASSFIRFGRNRNNAGNNNAGYGNNMNGGANQGSQLGVAMGGAGNNNPNPQPQGVPSLEDQAALITANHLAAINAGSPIAPLYPPTQFDSQAGIPPAP
jgi:hypothetical protein